MIEEVNEQNLEEILPLIREYMEFYEVKDISDARNRNFFSQFGRDSDFGCQFLFRKSGVAIGFATVYFSFVSSTASKIAILNDLYARPDHRGKGVGRKLIEHARDFASKRGASRLQWLTAPSNEAAQKLYDSLNTTKSTWLVYTYNTQ